MAISYKQKWQEANAEIDKLQAKIGTQRRKINELSAALLNQRAEGDQIVDLAGIARHMRVDPRYTPPQWRQRGLLPPTDYPEIREPIWRVSTIKEKFVIPTGRIWYDTPYDDGDLSPAA